MKKWLKSILFGVLLLFLVGCSEERQESKISEPVWTRQYREGSVLATVRLSETNILTTGQFRLVVDLQTSAKASIEFANIETVMEPFFVEGSFSEPSFELPNGRHQHRWLWVLAPKKVGDFVIQPFDIIVGGSELKTEPIKVQVKAAIQGEIEPFKIRDIGAPLSSLSKAPKWRLRGFALFLILLVCCVIAGLVVWRYRRTHLQEEPAPYEVALRALAHLSDERIERVHQLSRIIRSYMGARFDLMLSGKTTKEVVRIMESHPFSDMASDVVNFLVTCDEVRFSNQIPEGYEEQAEELVRNFIEATKPEEALCD